MGFKRRRDHHGPRLSPFESKLKWLKQHIIQIGEPSRLSREEVMRTIIEDITTLGEQAHSAILATLRATIYEQPHKISYLGYLLLRCPHQFQFLALEMAHDEAQTALQVGQYEKCKVFVRFLCVLHPIIKNIEVLQHGLKDLAQSGIPQLYKAALFAAFYLPSNLVPQDLREVFVNHSPSEEDTNEYDPFFGENVPYKVKHLGELFKGVSLDLQESWEPGIVPEDPLQPLGDIIPNTDSELKEEPQEEPQEEPKEEPKETTIETPRATDDSGLESATGHIISELVVHNLPASVDIPYPEVYFQCYFPIDGVNMVPPPNSPIGLLVRDVALDVIRRMEFSRREVTRQLIALDLFFNRDLFAPPGAWPDQIVEARKEDPKAPTYKVEDIALEAVFADMFNLAAPVTHRLPALVYYHSVLIEACVCAPQDIAPVLGRGLRFIFNNLDTADAELLFTLVDWFSHHVSNFAFTWKWNEWLDVLQLPRYHPKQVAVRELVNKQVRLSYQQRIEEVLPDEFKSLVPQPAEVPDYKFSNTEEGEKLLDLLSLSPSGEMDTEDAKQSSPEENAMDLLRNYNGSATDLLVTAVCHLGNRSVTHATTWIAKCEAVLREFATDKQQVIDSVFSYWSESKWVGALVLTQLIKSQLLTGAELVEYVVRHQDLLISSLGYECLTEYINEANAVIDDIKLEGEYSEWWTERLQKLIHRKVKTQKRFEESAANLNFSKEAIPAKPDEEADNATKNEEKDVTKDEQKDETKEEQKDESMEEDAPAPKRVRTE